MPEYFPLKSSHRIWIISILLIKKLRLKEVKGPRQGHTVNGRVRIWYQTDKSSKSCALSITPKYIFIKVVELQNKDLSHSGYKVEC